MFVAQPVQAPTFGVTLRCKSRAVKVLHRLGLILIKTIPRATMPKKFRAGGRKMRIEQGIAGGWDDGLGIEASPAVAAQYHQIRGFSRGEGQNFSQMVTKCSSFLLWVTTMRRELEINYFLIRKSRWPGSQVAAEGNMSGASSGCGRTIGLNPRRFKDVSQQHGRPVRASISGSVTRNRRAGC